MSEKKAASKKIKAGNSEIPEKSTVSMSSDKPKRKKAKVIEPTPVNSEPEASVISGQDGLLESSLSQQSPKKLKSALKASKIKSSSKKSPTCEVADCESLPKLKSKDSAEPVISEENKVVKSKSKSAKSRAPAVPAPELSEHEDECLLNGFETEAAGEADDSSDDDDNDEAFNQTSEFDPKHLPKASKRQKMKGKTDNSDSVAENSGVVYLGRIPHGFHEEEMTSYFNQFGETRRVRLSRNRQTGKSKHYGFIEFKHREVAQIVAETLQDYLLCGNMLQCKLLDKDEVHPRLWVGSGRKFRRDWKPRLAREKHNQPKSDDQQKIIADRLIKRETAKRKRMEELGITYDFPGYCSSTEPTKPVQPSKKKKAKALKDTGSTTVLKETPLIKSSDTSSAQIVDKISAEKTEISRKKKKARKSA